MAGGMERAPWRFRLQQSRCGSKACQRHTFDRASRSNNQCAAQGLHGAQAFAAHGLQGAQAFAAHGLHGWQALFAEHGLHAPQPAKAGPAATALDMASAVPRTRADFANVRLDCPDMKVSFGRTLKVPLR